MSQGILDFECPICYYEFDHVYKRPMTMNCGHSVCEDCSNKGMGTMKTCPKCRTLITTRAINFSLLGAIEQFEQQKTELLKLRARQSAQTREQDVTSGTLNELKNSLGNLKLESEAMQRQRAQETLAQINYLQNQVHQQVNQRQITDLNVQIIALQNRLSRENQSKDRRVEELEAKILEMQHKQQQPQTPRVDPVMEAKIAELERKLESSMQTSGRTMNWKAAFIRGLPESAKEKQIMHLVRLVNIDPEKEDVRIQLYTPATRGTCLVTFSTKESATKFIKNFDGQEFLSTGKKLKVEQASFDSRKQAADGQAKGTPAAAPTFVADKKKVFIRGLPVNVTPADVTKWIFEDSKKLLGNSVTVKLAGPVATCIAMFQDEASAKKILDKWNGKLYPGTSKELSVDYWKVLEGSISKNEPKSQKKGENNEKNEQKLKPQNQQTQKDQQKSEMQKSLPGNIVFLRNLPLETTESDLVVMFHQRAQIAQNPGDRRNKIDFQAAGANAKFKFAKITFVTDQDAQKIVREFDGKKFPNSDRVMGAAIFGQKKAEKAAGPSGGQNKKNNQTATNIVVVKGLPFETTVNDIVAKFHGVSKIQMDPNGYERVTLHKNPDGTPTGRATIVFKEADGAQKIVFEFNNADFQIGHSRPRKIQVELFNFKNINQQQAGQPSQNNPKKITTPSTPNQPAYGYVEMAMDALDAAEKISTIYANFKAPQPPQQQQKKQKPAKQQTSRPQQPQHLHQMSPATSYQPQQIESARSNKTPQSPRSSKQQQKEQNDGECSIQ